MLKTLNMARIRCPVGFSEEPIAFFPNENDLKLTPKMTKRQSFPFFKIYAISVKISTDSVVWNVENVHQ